MVQLVVFKVLKKKKAPQGLACSLQTIESAPQDSACSFQSTERAPHGSACSFQNTERAPHGSACSLKNTKSAPSAFVSVMNAACKKTTQCSFTVNPHLPSVLTYSLSYILTLKTTHI